MTDRQPPLTRLTLVRHADTAWSETGQHTGRTDLPLTPQGERRATTLLDRLDASHYAKVFTSPLLRARRTCELAGFGSAAVINDDLLEWDYGQYEGLTSAQIREQQSNWHLFRDGVPGGESPADVAGRADHFISTARACSGDVLAFASGHIIRMIAARWLGLAPLEGTHFFTATTSIGVLGFEHTQDQPVIQLWNETGTVRI